ncbi:MAG: baseplate J/gp47 family protein [Candidatus Doudnabacteria bacterium]|nr:baseplate J/gp47 family protein [Candidatus Doudnabacteria bacterium]
MDPLVIKLGKKDDIASVVKKIKDLKERDVVFELEKGSVLLSSSANLRLIKRTAEVLGKKVRVSTNDPMGKMIARKAEMLAGDEAEKVKRVVRNSSRFSDIVSSKRILPPQTLQSLNIKVPKLPSLPSFPKLKISKYFILGASAVVVILFALAVILPQAQITVYARSEPINRDFEIQVDSAAKQADQSTFTIPAELISREVSDTKTFTTTGTQISGTKATGAVTIYNNTSTTLRLRAVTTTLSANGKNFRFTADVSGIKPNGTTGPVAIEASEPGDSYNLAANTRLEIINSALGNRDVYAMNEAALAGGTSNGVKIFSQEDFDRAVVSMTEQLLAKVQEDLSATILPSGSNVEVLAKTASKEVGVEAESFDFTMIGRIRALVYKKDNLTSVMTENINSILSSDKYLLNSKDEIRAQFKSVDLAAGKGVLNVHFETTVAYKIDTTGLSRLLAGKTGPQIRDILLTKPEIDRVDVKFSPFWVNKAPRFNGKIRIQSKLNQE